MTVTTWHWQASLNAIHNMQIGWATAFQVQARNGEAKTLCVVCHVW